ncbi:ATP-dependent DNA helicase [Ceratobasidium sp. AG-Ba]|nr:ATP-dependent DNA helicase [Ceratobasidium sp. AG-Ba]
MSRMEFKVEMDVLNQGSMTTIDVRVVDRSIIDDEDLEHIFGSFPEDDTDRIDSEVYKPFVGIDMFYDQEASLKGIVLVSGTQALVIRVPADIAKKSAAAYEKETKEAAKKAKTQSSGKAKEKMKGQPVVPRTTSLDRLRKLLQSNLVGFGMAQISLTLWHFLRERVNGVNLSTVLSKPIQPPVIPTEKKDPSSTTDADKRTDGSAQKSSKGGSRKKGRQGGSSAPKKGPEKRNPDKPEAKENDTETVKPVSSPDDEVLNLDRLPISPGEVVQEIFPKVEKITINSLFMGEHEAIDLQERVGEAAIRAWIAFIVADNLKAKVQNAPVVKPSFLPDRELTFFAESMVTKWKFLGETSPVRTLQLKDYDFGGDEVESRNYANKIRASKYQYMAYSQDGNEKRYFLKRSNKKTNKHTRLAENEDESEEEQAPPSQPSQDDGWTVSRGGRRGHQQRRKGQVRNFSAEDFEHREPEPSTPDPESRGIHVDIPEDTEVFLYGREEDTSSDKAHDMFLLRLLEGRGSLHGPKYKDCAFIRRVWFPNLAQIRIGEERNARKSKSKKERGKQDFVYDSWGDDTDEDEAARIQALSLTEGNEDRDDETEDENVGSDDPKRGVTLPDIPLNSSQLGVIGRIVAPNPNRRPRATLVHGPPGTGKTSTIAAAVIILAKLDEPVWIVAQSNVGIRNVAEKLQEVGLQEFVLLVAQEYSSYWEKRYKSLKGYYFLSNLLSKPQYQKRLFESKHLFYKHRSTLTSVCWFGDPNQLPPYGSSDGAEIKDIFKMDHLLANSRLLDTSYRLPVPVAKFISDRMYKGELKPFVKHKVQDPRKAVVFVDVASGEEERAGNEGRSWKNTAEAEIVIQLVQKYYERRVKQDWEEEERQLEYAVITPYEGQRAYVQSMMEDAGLRDRQGNEADYIITTIAKTGSPGFLTSQNRMNVLLTRCKRGLVVVTQKDFAQRTDSLLRGLIYSLEPYNPWVSAEDVIAGYVNLPGSPALNKRPTPQVARPVPASRTSLPPRPGAAPSPVTGSSPLAAQVVRQGLVPQSELPPNPTVKGAWGNSAGVNRVKSAWSR